MTTIMPKRATKKASANRAATPKTTDSATTPPRPRLTDRQVEVLAVVVAWSNRDVLGRSPTYRDLAIVFGCHPSTVFDHVGALREKGCVSEDSGYTAGIVVTDLGHEIAAEWIAANPGDTRLQPGSCMH